MHNGIVAVSEKRIYYLNHLNITNGSSILFIPNDLHYGILKGSIIIVLCIALRFSMRGSWFKFLLLNSGSLQSHLILHPSTDTTGLIRPKQLCSAEFFIG